MLVGSGDSPGGGQPLVAIAGVEPGLGKKQSAGVQGQQLGVLLPGPLQLRRFPGQTAQLLGRSAAGGQFAAHVIAIEEQQLVVIAWFWVGGPGEWGRQADDQ